MEPNTNNPSDQPLPITVSPSAEPVVSDSNNVSPDEAYQPQVVVSPDVMPGPAAPAAPVMPTTVAPAPGAVTTGDFSAPAAPAAQPPQPPLPGQFTAAPPPAYGTPGGPMPVQPAPKKSRSFKKLIIALAAVLVIGAGSAAAYVGIVVPNQPANVLKKALVNTLQQKQVSFKGTLEASSGAGGLAVKSDINAASNATAKTADVQLNLPISGVSFPIEARLVNNNVYVKVGDISTIASLIGTYSPDAGSLANTLSTQLSNKWIVIDSTLLDESGVSCALNGSWGLSQADIQLLETQYNKNPFVTIQSTSSDPVNGQAAQKFVLSIDDDKATAYANSKNLENNLSMVKTLQKCDKSGTTTLPNTSNATGDHGKTPITIWIDKANKRIVKVALQDSGKASQGGATGNFTATLSYNPVSISAPPNAESAIQVFTNIQKDVASNPALANLFSGMSGSTSSSTLSQ